MEIYLPHTHYNCTKTRSWFAGSGVSPVAGGYGEKFISLRSKIRVCKLELHNLFNSWPKILLLTYHISGLYIHVEG